MTFLTENAVRSAAPVVATAAGRVRGALEDGVAVFRGIPYAEPPVGALRFRPPARRRAWDGVRDATRFGPSHPQGEDPVEGALMNHALRPPAGDDCLSLNVWTPDPGAARLPVLVWLHGGSLKYGAGSDAIYDGATFARDGIVTVTLNYRLHPAGYLYVRDRPGAGTFGLLDQVAALEWVRENIAAFGGNPDAVTVAGESAGAHSIGQLLAAPAARGLFGRAVLQSGAASFDVPAEAAAVIGDAVLGRLGVQPGDDDAIAALTTTDLLAATAEVEPAMLDLLEQHGIRPNVMSVATHVTSLSTYDDDVMPRRALDAIANGAARNVDLLIGTNVDEAALFGPQFCSLAPGVAAAAFGARGSSVLGEYERRRHDRPERDANVDLTTDTIFRIPAIKLAEAARPYSARTYMYLLAYGSPPAPGGLGAIHGLDLPFMWNRVDDVADQVLSLAGTPPSAALAATMHGAWGAFVKTGRPEHRNLPEWPAYDVDRRATMRLDERSTIVDDPDAKERELWDDVTF